MQTDVVIVGGGPAGAASALFLHKQGIKSIIVEKEAFPRYHIGESLTTRAGNLLRELGFEAEMLDWEHPRKVGVKVYGPEGKNSFYVPVMGRDDNGELYDTYTWQVRRADFDNMLMEKARECGVEAIDGRALRPIQDGDKVVGVEVQLDDGETVEIASKVLIDASGQSTFLAGAGLTSPKDRDRYDNQVAIFSQVRNTRRDIDNRDDTLIFYQKMFHWAWFIPLDDDVVSVGVTVPTEYFQSQDKSPEAFLLRELGELNSELDIRVPDRTFLEPVRATSNYSYHIERFAGDGWLCVGDSHRFIDPIFSFGVTFAIAEAKKAANAIAAYLSEDNQGDVASLLAYQEDAESGQDVIQALIDAFWNHPFAFAFFAHSRYVEDFVDMFAGRIYMDEPSRGLQAIHTINEQDPGKIAGQLA
ncbi:MAG: tryptophan 7-halogenase [Anaerolineae bacterium]|nr:tryptophan 7-halogenase [Anaerolineae bacterium]